MKPEALAKDVIKFMRKKKATLAIAESCTGGLLSDTITNVPGSSDVFLGGLVAYNNEMKTKVLGVPQKLIVKHGAVSEANARAMSNAVRKLLIADVGVGITGIAGPGGGTEEKPVGLVYISVSFAVETIVDEFRFDGSRRDIKEEARDAALDMLEKTISTNL